GAYLMMMAFFYVLPGYTNVFQSFYRGCGKMYTTMLGTTIQITVRTIFTYILAPVVGIKGVAVASALGWALMLLFEIPYYFVTCRKRGFPRKERAEA
ncbi:MAG: polysaccharide biosynthesis C-terminal domain-containing protein, partial [Spirochaetales bacterium]|nr:polysaccharide biosynthesis C-terminal domain-containing protein [Candidatus Physcosoma equi]